jgi:hypothetical protein
LPGLTASRLELAVLGRAEPAAAAAVVRNAVPVADAVRGLALALAGRIAATGRGGAP